MDREKAIQILKRCEAEAYCSHYKHHFCCIGCGQREALDLAIEALGEPTVSEKEIVDFNNMISADDRIRNLPSITPNEMTLEEWQELDRAIQCDAETLEDMGEVSDGYHTFNQLYHQRAVLFATIVNQNKDKAWKSWKHEDGKFCFDKGGGWFIVGVDTPEGSYTYHYEQKYWNMFDCEELDKGKHWDGHTEEDVTRLLSLPPVTPTERTGEWIPVTKVYRTTEADFPKTHIEWETATEPDEIDAVRCSECGEVFDFEDARNWCTECGAKMGGDNDEK